MKFIYRGAGMKKAEWYLSDLSSFLSSELPESSSTGFDLSLKK
jgi:hypothetical protein